jgi:hypothetical protein
MIFGVDRNGRPAVKLDGRSVFTQGVLLLPDPSFLGFPTIVLWCLLFSEDLCLKVTKHLGEVIDGSL